MKTLHALFIAIDEYPIAHHVLRGCRNDAEAINVFLRRHCQTQGWNYRPRVIYDQSATRQGIVDGFDHFAEAADGDVALFFFSGHGSRMSSPEAFRHIDLDGRCESLVAHDSRLPDGRDLADKELGFLIWKATQGKNLHFTAIFDCCHAGSITRNADQGITFRMAEPNITPVNVGELLGYEQYLIEGERLLPRQGPHVSLAAARPYESALEMDIDGRRRGLFSTMLLDTLEQSKGQRLTYRELMSRVQTRVHNRAAYQHPQLETSGELDPDNLFLGGAVSGERSRVVKYDRRHGWIVELGQMHGVKAGGEAIVTDEGKRYRTAVRDAGPAQCTLDDWQGSDPEKEYLLAGIEQYRRSVPLAFAPGFDPAGPEGRSLREAFQQRSAASFEWVDDRKAAAYWVDYGPNGFVLVRPSMPRPVFQAISPRKWPNAASLFWENAEKVAHWENVAELTNPLSRIQVTEELEIAFYEATDHDDYRTLRRRERRDIAAWPIFAYRFVNGAWRKPAMMLEARNIGARSLWVGGVLLSEDFSITDIYMPPKELPPGAAPYEFSAYDPRSQHTFRLLPLHVPDEILSWGETIIANQIKVFVSTTPFDLRDLTQDGLALEPRGPVRGAGARGLRKYSSQADDWTSIDVNFRIHRPQPGQVFQKDLPLDLGILLLTPHPAFTSAQIRLASTEEMALATGLAPPSRLPGGAVISPLRLGDGRLLDALEIHDPRQLESIDESNPLVFSIAELDERITLSIFAYHPLAGKFIELPLARSGAQISITRLPVPIGNAAVSELPLSVKLFFRARES
jgi:hypothetical protein